MECDTSLPSKSIENNARPSGKAGVLTTSSVFSSQTATASTATFTTSTRATTTTSTTTEVETDSRATSTQAPTTSEDIAITTDNTTIIDIATTSDTPTTTEITTTTQTTSSSLTTEAVVSTASPNGRRIDNLECGDHGRNSGNNCICFDGYRGVLCQIPPIDLVCDKDRIQVTLSGDYAKDCFLIKTSLICLASK